MRRLKEISERIRENINQFVEAVDGTDSILDEAIFEMKERLDEAKELVAIAITEEQKLKLARQEAVDAANMWKEKADTALQNNDIASASEARQRRQQHLDIADDYKCQIVAQQAVVASLKTALREFYQQFQTVARHAETLSHRQKQAETRAELYKLIAAGEKAISDVLVQAEQKLKTAEEKAEVWENQNRRDTVEVKRNTDSFNLDEALAELKSDVLDSREK